MEIRDKIKAVFVKVLKVDESVYVEDLAVGDIPEWDSVNHVRLLQEVEDYFEISIDIADAIDIEDITDLEMTVKKYIN
tara:strand:+ start:4280 stop:4513 length:234 start_codon:yes stop_codon:yes gene_type:complete